jgi:hypothetical protein
MVEVLPGAVVRGQNRGQIRQLAVVVVEMDAGRGGAVLRPRVFFPKPGQPAGVAYARGSS